MAFDAFLKIDGIDGESRVVGMEKSIEVHSYSFGAQNTASTAAGSGAGAGKVDFTDLSFVVSQSVATVPLIRSVATGVHHAAATLSLRSAGADNPVEFYTVTMSDVLVSSFHEAGSASDPRPSNAFSLTFSKIQWSYRDQSPSGKLSPPITFAWDGSKGTA